MNLFTLLVAVAAVFLVSFGAGVAFALCRAARNGDTIMRRMLR